jgi:hypothetical protein
VKHDVDSLKRRRHRLAVSHIAFDEFHIVSDPGRFSFAVGLRLEVVENANGPAFSLQLIRDVRTDQPRSTGHERAFLMRGHGG